MRFAHAVVAIHPAIVTITFVTLFAAPSLAQMVPVDSAASNYALGVALIPMLLCGMLWHFCLYRAASGRSAKFVGHAGRRAFLFALSALGLGVMFFAFPATMRAAIGTPSYADAIDVQSIGMVVGVLAYFAAIWAASNALTRFEERSRHATLHKTLGTFLLEFYLPIGIWFLHPRIKRLIGAPAKEAA